MSEGLKCPLCGCNELVKNKSASEKYFTFVLEDKWICQNCGCFFSEEDARNKKIMATKISKKGFFNIIFSAIQEICKKQLTRVEKKQIMDEYAFHTNVFYKEVAEMQANLFLESDCIQKDNWLIEKLHSLEPKFYLPE